MVFTTKYAKVKSGKRPPLVANFAKGGVVPRPTGNYSANYFDGRDERSTLIDVENTAYQRSNENDRNDYGTKRFFDDGTKIPGWQAGRNDAYRERRGEKRLIDEDK